ncbi:MAG: cardiolipin synthase [Gemmatimonadetes bacterium]|nr:cardiolipin synthase [Gemmatimonadota bacterium]
MIDFLTTTWPMVVATLTVLLAVVASAHVVLYKRDSRSAAGWVGVVLVFPILGAVLYALLGINRIKRLATELRQERMRLEATTAELQHQHQQIEEVLRPQDAHLAALGRLVDRITHIPVTAGNRVRLLVNGDQAYPAMLEAIDGAEHSVALSTYIFDNDNTGLKFVDALERAVQRGVQVRVLIDGVGALYSWPSIVKELEDRDIPVARFLHSFFPWRMPFMNLRCHRKIVVADGQVGFTGGMNIREGHVLAHHPPAPVQDVHFQFEGPVVAHLMHMFAEDWAFTTREGLSGAEWFPSLESRGAVAARGIADGPDEDLDKLRWTLLGALARAQHRVRIMTPYFLPDATLITSLNLAALRDVEVEIIVPAVSNLRFVKWASQAELWQVLTHGCRVYETPSPFDHSKIMVVDDAWSLVGSANWDPRSLRLNFEFNVECYGTDLVDGLNEFIDGKIQRCREVTLEEVNGRSLPVKLRDGVTRLFKPYL